MAILAVVLYHAHLGALPGGYVGVDVFFVISGYLITDLLWREVSTGGRLSFRGFYGRRIRRLLPASLLVLAVTAVATALIVPPLTARVDLKDGLWCALYVGNYRFAFLQTNYLTIGAAVSPFQQYWSLGVEEQFYLVWPAVLLLASMAWRARGAAGARHRHRRRRRVSRAGAFAALAAIAAGSFAFSLWLTKANEPWAFFSLPTRAWELAVGGLIALGAHRIERLRGRHLLGWAGLGLVVWSVVTYTSSTPFPGWAALAPVLGTAAVIAAGCGGPSRYGPVFVLRRPPMQVVGRISYSWYLWHWPILILVPVAVGHALSLPQNLLLVALSFLLAAATFVLVERPVRSSSWLAAFPWRSIRLGGALTALAVAACVLSVLLLPSLQGTGHAPVANAALRRSDRAVASSTLHPAANPLVNQEDAATAAVQAQVARSIGVKDVPSNLQPTLPNANADEPPVFVDGCLDSYTDASLQNCVFGDTSSNVTVLLYGDSHAAMWFPAVDAAAIKYGWRLITWTKATCPPFPLPIFSPVLGRTFSECDQWNANVMAQIAAIHPALVILGVARHYTDIYNFTPYSPTWLNGMGEQVAAIRKLGSQVMVFGPVPKPPFDVPGCLSTNLTNATACDVPVSVGLNELGIAAEASTVRIAGGTYVDTQPWFCTATTCAVMVDNLVVYRDDNHLTQTYANFLTPVVEPELEQAFQGPAQVPPQARH